VTHPVSLVLVDIDRLKIANDRFGHEAGDDLVRAVAGEIHQNQPARPAPQGRRTALREHAPRRRPGDRR
jgi:predicted signal transduction protein with EAL and GGDEF domain